MENQTKRLNKYLASTGYCSRREADRLIKEGAVTVNGTQATLGQQISNKDFIKVHGKPLKSNQKKVSTYIVLNKPRGIISTTDQSVQGNIIDFLNWPSRVFPVGRLDKDTEGLILLTDDGDIVNRILRSKYGHEKEYLVEVDHVFDDVFIDAMESGVRILGQRTKSAKLKRLSPKRFRLTITQGLNRQIRRMCEALGYRVTYLKRLRIMNITIGNLAPGMYRIMGSKEITQLKQLLDRSEQILGEK